jgi:hypothetical protein
MRVLLVGLSLVSASSFRVCGSEESAPKAAASADVAVAASATATAELTPAKARIGGRVVAVGDHSVEVLLHQSGLAEALVSDASGKLVSEGIALSLVVNGASQAKENIALAFSAPRARFEGRAKAGVELATGPVELSLSVAGKPMQAKLASALVVKGPEFGGNVLVVGDHSAELLLRSNGEVLAFLRDAAGVAVHSEAGLALNASVRTAAGASENVALHFDAARKCFAGQVKAGVGLSPGPVELSITGKGGVALGGLSQIALRVDASHGGEVLVVGDYSVELVAQGKELHAFVFDAAGKASTAANLDLRLDLAALVHPDASLTWDAPSGSYRAALNGKVDFDAQPIRVMLTAGGRAFVGAAASLQAVAGARIAPIKLGADAKLEQNAKLDADAKLGANAKLGAGAKLKLPEVKSNLAANAAKSVNAAAQVNLTPPKVSVEKSASASVGSKTGGGAKASAGFSIGTK